MFKSFGYTKPGLDLLSKEFRLERHTHSALSDVQILCKVFKGQTILYTYKFRDLMFYLYEKLPVSIQKIKHWAQKCRSKQDLEILLSKFVKNKTALNANQILKIARWYFKDRFVVCK